MTKLSGAQAEILTAATHSEDGVCLAPPDAKSAVAGLIKRGFLISVPRADGPSQLLITIAGKAAMTPPTDESAAEKPAASAENAAPANVRSASSPSATSEPKGKIAALLGLLRQTDGATVDAMMAATGWQAHSVRGAISGAIKKKLGITVVSAKVDSVRTYRIEAGQ